MPHRPEHAYGVGTLPAPELNPLLNPVLGQHMGRWAEVYFRSPPEKREQAVLELLRELEMENSIRAGASDTSPSLVQGPGRDSVPALQVEEVPQTTVRCQNCGRINPATHKFCGMCGKTVTGPAASSDLNVSDLHVADLHIADLHENPLQNAEPSYERTQGTQALPLFQSLGGLDYREDDRGVRGSDHGNDYGGAHDPELFAYSAAPRSYRLYVGLVLVTMLVGLAYLAWRTTENAQSTRVESQSPPPIATEPSAPAPASSVTPKSDTPDHATPPAPSATVPSEADTGNRKDAARADARKTASAEAKAVPPPTAVAEKNPGRIPGTLPGAGDEELAMALNYLNGTNGQERNHSEAAKWLWKSVSKQNADATLVLSDLYLKGDGVGKNCDQGRILLDAAARKGMKQAGERLRHLQAFGCL